jgi:hypothetical protein
MCAQAALAEKRGQYANEARARKMVATIISKQNVIEERIYRFAAAAVG